ncbi:MAG: type II toxin-antitoxin system VapC family toxin [Beijerinckiaceae bacterium]
MDASAIVAILLREPRYEQLFAVLQDSGEAFTSPVSVYEATMAIARELELPQTAAHERVMRFLNSVGIEVAPITLDIASAAIFAVERFGKGRHKAKLNMGDCFSYAMASARKARILFVGNDFSQTDLIPALPAPN